MSNNSFHVLTAELSSPGSHLNDRSCLLLVHIEMTGAEGRWRDKGGAGLENDKEKERENGKGRRLEGKW